VHATKANDAHKPIELMNRNAMTGRYSIVSRRAHASVSTHATAHGRLDQLLRGDGDAAELMLHRFELVPVGAGDARARPSAVDVHDEAAALARWALVLTFSK
jgi:hypothetical protein